jgi:hypothetical protein
LKVSEVACGKFDSIMPTKKAQLEADDDDNDDDDDDNNSNESGSSPPSSSVQKPKPKVNKQIMKKPAVCKRPATKF